ncbi:MAG TPA: RIP metalloprotease RseP [Bdellovibrionota bacterium]|nr:RIP metalloprotease RseP [Bdellovibrionota bacterium]
MSQVIGFLLILGPLVVVHEFGHFLFAKLFKVRADIFSVGFGPRLFGKQIGETEFRLSAIPLGGYVKLFGEDLDQEMTPSERERALYAQAPWKRFMIFFGGPLFNFIFAVLVFMVILVVGEPHVAAVAGRVVSGSYAEKIGFSTGDHILAVDGKQVHTFNEVILAMNEAGDRELEVEVQRRAGPHQTLKVRPQLQEGFSQYGEEKQVGHVPGLTAIPRTAEVGVSNPSSAAGKAGLKTGDLVNAWDGKAIKTWEEIENAYGETPDGGTVTLSVTRSGGAPRDVKFTKKADGRSPGSDWGLYSSELFVESILDGQPAQAAGIQKGDRVVKVGTIEVPSFFDLKDEIQSAAQHNGRVRVSWERDGKMREAMLTPTENKRTGPTLKSSTEYTIGVAPMLKMAEPETVVERVFNPFVLLYRGVDRTVEISWRNLVSLGKMVTGDVSIKTLGGPILIGKIAGDSLSRGLIQFLTIMAVLSVGLGILNVLPIPVLDGGHLLLLGIESIRGKALTIRQMEIVQQVGLSLILLIMVIVIRNDLARLALFD